MLNYTIVNAELNIVVLQDYFPDRTQKLTDGDIDDIIDRLAGFSKVIDQIHGSGKPVVGHNCLTDLLLTYQLFWDNLPS